MNDNFQDIQNLPEETTSNPGRRKFLGHLTKAAAATAAVGAIGLKPFLGGKESEALAAGPPRRNVARAIRMNAAQFNFQNTPPHLNRPNNGDEALYPNRIGSYSKGLPHQANGEVVPAAYNALLAAVNSGNPADFDAIPLGANPNVKLTSPQAGFAFDLEGRDAFSFRQPPAPAFASREEAAEIAENYWMALLRDVSFDDYQNNQIADDAAADLTSYGADFKGPKTNSGVVTKELLFRGLTPGDRRGPWLSQFFMLPCNFGANAINQQTRTVLGVGNGGQDYMRTFSSWLDVQNGVPQPGDIFDNGPLHYMKNGRDIGQWVHIDVLFQGYFQALLCMFGVGTPFDAGNPYSGNPTQAGFATFGGPHIATLLCEVSTRALKAVWNQKWLVHRRLRPEVFAARIHRTVNNGAGYPIDPQILNSVASGTPGQLGAYLGTNNALLPMAFPEGSPTHPAYGAGHATVAGACTTILKAWFNESTIIQNPVEVDPNDPTQTRPYSGSDTLRIGGELNKIASNVAIGRNIAGVHWRSDATESLLLGEEIAISILRDQRSCYNEVFNGFSLTKFNGTTITV